VDQRAFVDLAVIALLVTSVWAFPPPAGSLATIVGPTIQSSTRDPILIEGDAGFTAANGVVGGSGTSLDPFVIEGWEIHAGPRNGIEIRNTTDAFLIRAVRVRDADYDRLGVYLLNVTGARLDNSSISSNNWAGVVIERSRSVLVETSYFSRNSGAGVLLVETVDALVRDNVFSGNTGGGLGLGQSDQVSVINNVFHRNYLGGVFWAGSTGLSGSGRDTTIYANGFTANGEDIDLVEPSNIAVTFNKVDGTNGPGGTGFFFRWARNASIVANNVSTHAGGGFSFWYSSNVTLRQNRIQDNNAWGVYLFSSTAFLLHDNDFVANWQQVRIDESLGLAWNRSYPLGGNHWSDYTGSDACGGAAQDACTGPDGFGDTPYAVNSTNEDWYPLMARRGLPGVPPVASLIPEPMVGNVTTDFESNASFSWDLNDPSSRLEFRWDWELDGTWDTDWGAKSVGVHRYNLPGVYFVQVQVRDSENLTDVVSALVVVTTAEAGAGPDSSVAAIVVAAVVATVSIAVGSIFFVIRRRRRRSPPPGLDDIDGGKSSHRRS